jgi:hypothetical protein
MSRSVPLSVTTGDLVTVEKGDIVRILTVPPGDSLGLVVDVELPSHDSVKLWTGDVRVTVLTESCELMSFRLCTIPGWGVREVCLILKL